MDLINQKTQINSMYERQNDLLIHIAGLSDYVLKEQAIEQYAILQHTIKEKEQKYLDSFIRELAISHVEEYMSLFNFTDDILKALSYTNKIDYDNLILDINKKRMRIPTQQHLISLNSNRRNLALLTQYLNCTIDILDLEGYEIDSIGVGKTQYYLYINQFDRFTNIDISMLSNTARSIMYAVPKWALYYG